MGFSQAPGLPYSKLGIPEDGDTASQAIDKDKYVIWKGGNYFAKTDILQGEAFVVDTNLTEIPDGAINGIVEALSASIKVLYNNPTPTSELAGTHTLSEDISHFKYYEIIFKGHVNASTFSSTGKIPVGKLVELIDFYDGYIRGREIAGLSGTTISFGLGYYRSSVGGVKTNEDADCIISQVIGYR